MLLSIRVWAIIIAHVGSVYGFHTIVTQLPTYSKTILHFDIKSNGYLSALPYIGKYCFALVTSFVADLLMKKENVSKTFVRKFFTFIGEFGSS